MSTVTIYGASDDLIELEGAIREEFSPTDSVSFLGFSDGTLLTVSYTNEGIWRIAARRKGTATLTVEQCTSDGEGDDYTDRATLEGDIRWVLHGPQFADAR